MAFPFLHMAIGIGIGVLGAVFMMMTQRQLTYEETPRCSRSQYRSSNTSSNQSSSRSSNQSSSQPSFKGMSAGENCIICLHVMTENNILKLKCGHALHRKCFEDCLNRHHTACPLCRRKMEQNN